MTDCKDSATNVEVAEITAIMKTESGRNVMMRLLSSTGYFADSFDPDPLKHAYNAGRRSIGLNMVATLNDATSGEFQMMLKEYFKDE